MKGIKKNGRDEMLSHAANIFNRGHIGKALRRIHSLSNGLQRQAALSWGYTGKKVQATNLGSFERTVKIGGNRRGKIRIKTVFGPKMYVNCGK